jgi:hypothetical protein
VFSFVVGILLSPPVPKIPKLIDFLGHCRFPLI